MGRTFLIGGNWKMNGDLDLIDKISSSLNTASLASGVQVVVAPPFPFLPAARSKFSKAIGVSAQNCSFEKSGAFTGEVSVDMLKSISIDWVILGHSERRELYGDSDDIVGKKVAFSAKNKMNVIACVGEKLSEREANQTTAVVFRQLEAIKKKLSVEDWAFIVIAYEPVWAIGTGKVATPEQAQEVHQEIRSWLSKNISPAVADATRILYGGSVNAKNASDLQKEKDIDGFLVGGASLKADDFLTICKSKV